MTLSNTFGSKSPIGTLWCCKQVCRVRDKWVVELWDGTDLHANVDSPVAAAQLHRELVVEADSNVAGVDIDRAD